MRHIAGVEITFRIKIKAEDESSGRSFKGRRRAIGRDPHDVAEPGAAPDTAVGMHRDPFRVA